MDTNAWINNPKIIEKSKKSYAHFDNRTDISKVKKYITNPQKVAKHSFFPFIHYEMKMNKFNKEKGIRKKTREICYAAHLDRCIFQYYGWQLNELYNERIKELGIDSVPVAYRTDLHKNNIHFAKEAFDFIKSCEKCYVMIGDFTKFFDCLDHKYLKEQWCSLLKCRSLPDDHYAVFKNITKYSTWELKDLLTLNGLECNDKGRKLLNKRKIVLSRDDFHKYRSHIKKNTKNNQIPQGSPISAVLANIYMLEADKWIFDYVKSMNGFYMRYSDDFIIIIPQKDEDLANIFNPILNRLKGTKNLELEPSKTQLFKVESNTVVNIGKELLRDADSSNRFINFLGFTFDGKNVSLRAKTVSKYYYRMYRKARSISKNPGQVGADKLYKRYSQNGAYVKPGNFFTYVNHAEEIFGEDELIYRDLRRHMPKIRKALNSNKDIKNL